jgi:hypothetical protein
MRENRSYGSEGGEGCTLPDPIRKAGVGARRARDRGDRISDCFAVAA